MSDPRTLRSEKTSEKQMPTVGAVAEISARFPDGAGAKLLVVGEDEGELDSLSLILASAGFLVAIVPTAESALAKLSVERADLVLANTVLPGLTGRDLCRVLRGDLAHAELPFLLVTSARDRSAPFSALECGADGFLMRPFEPKALVRRIRWLLAGRTRDAASGDSVSVQFQAHRLDVAVAPRTIESLAFGLDETLRVVSELTVKNDALSVAHVAIERYARRLESEVELADGKYRALARGAGDGLFVTDGRGIVLEMNECGEAMLGATRRDVLGHHLFASVGVAPESPDSVFRALTGTPKPLDLVLRRDTAQEVWLEFSGSQMTGSDDHLVLIIARDVTERRRTIEELKATERALRGAIEERAQIQAELVQAQKLEAVGQLAAGIAHEINTPTQYIGDNVEFLRTAIGRLGPILDAYAELAERVREGREAADVVARLDQTTEKSRLPYLREQMPRAIEQSLEGIERVSTIVQAMKEFSHLGSAEKSDLDINRAIRSTATVAQNEWKYVAELVLDLGDDLPTVPCLPGEFNQAILNIVINAVHAIEAKPGRVDKGKITISTRVLGDHMEIRIADTGTGIPAAIQDKVFNPFFTTKVVGKGTGQGLAIARSVIVDKHRGRFFFETEDGVGTTFVIQLPLGIADRETSA